MNVQELASAAQSLSFEQRRELIKMLFAQQPKPNTQEPSIVWVGDLEAGSREIREQINASLEASAASLAAEEANDSAASPQHNSNFSPNLNWLEEHRAEYAGQWVALHDGRLIAHSSDGEALVEPVRQAGVHCPMIVFVEPPACAEEPPAATSAESTDSANEAQPQPLSPLAQMLLSHAGTVEGLPPDFALNHDHYLYGADKRQ